MNQIGPLKKKIGRREAWEVWVFLWHMSFYPLLMLCGLLSWADIAESQRMLMVLVSLMLAIWHMLSLKQERPVWEHYPLWTLIYWGVGLGLWTLLTRISAGYDLMLFGLYAEVCIQLVRWQALIGIGALSLIWAFPYLYRWDIGSILTVLLNAILIGVFKVFIEGVIAQNEARRTLIQTLEATRSELAAAEREAGRLAERQRLASDIHDTLAQGFTSVVLNLEAAEAALPPEAKQAQKYIDQARQVARESLSEARRIVWALQPEQLKRASLAETLRRTALGWQAETGIPVQATVTGQARALRPEIEVTLLRATQEGLANIRRHAGASRAALTVSYMDDQVMLDLHDDGKGFAPSRLPVEVDAMRGGYGLRAMRERVTQLGGTLTIESAPGEGTTLAIALPAMVEATSETVQGNHETTNTDCG